MLVADGLEVGDPKSCGAICENCLILSLPKGVNQKIAPSNITVSLLSSAIHRAFANLVRKVCMSSGLKWEIGSLMRSNENKLSCGERERARLRVERF